MTLRHETIRQLIVSDNNLSTGLYNYYLKTNYYAGETGASNQVSVQIGSGTYYTISASANPTEGGTVTGMGPYLAGQTCTLNATANGGYSFVNWTRNGTSVSTNASYSFTVTGNATYVALRLRRNFKFLRNIIRMQTIRIVSM